jgi:hypothetical protein
MERRASRQQRWGRYAERIADAYGLVLLLVVATYAVASLTTYRGWSAVAVTALASATGVVALGGSQVAPPRVHAASTAAAGAVLLAAVSALGGGRGFLAAAALLQAALLVLASGAVLRAVLTESEVNFKTILGAISVYMVFGLLFTSLYVAIDRFEAGGFFAEAHARTGDFVFFSFTTLTTTGYGNLVPANQPGKMFAGLEMLLGQIFLVTLIAGLVSLWRPRRP